MESEKDWAFWSSASETSVRNKKRRIVYPENQMHAMEEGYFIGADVVAEDARETAVTETVQKTN